MLAVTIAHAVIAVAVTASVTVLGSLHVLDTAAITTILGVVVGGQAATNVVQARKGGS